MQWGAVVVWLPFKCSAWMLTHASSEISYSHTQFPLPKMTNIVCLISQLYPKHGNLSHFNAGGPRRYSRRINKSIPSMPDVRKTGLSVWRQPVRFLRKKTSAHTRAVHTKPHGFRLRQMVLFFFPVSRFLWHWGSEVNWKREHNS